MVKWKTIWKWFLSFSFRAPVLNHYYNLVFQVVKLIHLILGNWLNQSQSLTATSWCRSWIISFFVWRFIQTYPKIKTSKVWKWKRGNTFRSWEEWIWKVNWHPTDWIIRPFILHLSICVFSNVLQLDSGAKIEDYKRMNPGVTFNDRQHRLVYPFIFSWHFNFNMNDKTDSSIFFLQHLNFTNTGILYRFMCVWIFLMA